MHTSIWYHIADYRPSKTGYYLAYKLPSLGDDEEGYGVYYWDNEYTDWRESAAPHSYGLQVSVWTEYPEHESIAHRRIGRITQTPSVAEIDAWNNVLDAISKYNMVKTLVR